MLTTTTFDELAAVSIEERVKDKYKEEFAKMEKELLEEWREAAKDLNLKRELTEVRIIPRIEVITEEVKQII